MFKNDPDLRMNNLLNEHPLSLKITIAASSPEKCERRLTLLRDWSFWFDALCINIDLVLCGKACSQADESIASWFGVPVCLYFDPDYSLAREEGLLLNRPVFGQERKSAFSSLILYDQGQVCFECRRISCASLEKLISRAMKIQHEWLQAHITAFVDRTLTD